MIPQIRSAAPARTPRVTTGRITEPFRTTEQAWFWTMQALAARHEGTGRSGAGTPRPCEPDDVIKALDALYRQRRIDLVHARIMRRWGERGCAPNLALGSERADALVWQEAMERLGWKLRVKGIVV